MATTLQIATRITQTPYTANRRAFEPGNYSSELDNFFSDFAYGNEPTPDHPMTIPEPIGHDGLSHLLAEITFFGEAL